MDDNVEITGDIEGFFLDYESGALAATYDEAIARQKETFRLYCNRQEGFLRYSIADDIDGLITTVDASED